MREWWWQLFVGALSAVLVWALLEAETTIDVISVLLNGLIAAIVGLSCAFAVGLFHARGAVRALLKAGHKKPDIVGQIQRDWLYFRSERFVLASEGISTGWMLLDADEVRAFYKLCFRRCRGKYIGTDRHVPSEFFHLYPEYLGSQRARGVSRGDIRFVLYDWDELLQDLATDSGDVQRFIQAHVDDGVRLLRVDGDVARREAARQALPSSDVGLFGGRFAVFFNPPSANEARFGIKVEEIAARGDALEAFLMQLVEAAELVELDNGRVVRRLIDDESRAADKAALRRERWRRQF